MRMPVKKEETKTGERASRDRQLAARQASERDRFMHSERELRLPVS
jgi:hypothetical protein